MSVLRALVRLHGRAFAEHALPLLVALMLGGAILLGPHGLQPKMVAAAMSKDAVLRVAIAVVFGVFARPATQALLLPPGSTWIRSAPIGLLRVRLVAAAFVVVVHAPLVVLGAVRGPVLAIVPASLSIALAMARVRFAEVLALLVTFVAASFASRGPLVVPVALFAVAGLFSSAFRRAPERARRALRVPLRLPPFAAVLVAHAVSLVRLESSRLSRTFAALAVVAFFGATVVGSDARIDGLGALLAVTGVAGALALAMLGRALGRARRRMRPWVKVAGRSVRGAFVAASVVQAAPTLAAVAFFVVLRKGQVGATHATLAAVFAFALAAIGLRLEDGIAARGRDPSTLWVLASVGLAAASLVLASVPVVTVVVALVAGVLAVVLPDREVPLARA